MLTQTVMANSTTAEIVSCTFQSTVWLLPRALFTKDAVLVGTPSHKYTANEYVTVT